MNVKRFDFGTRYRGNTGVPDIVQKAGGEYVRYEDYAELLGHVEAIGAGGVSSQRVTSRRGGEQLEDGWRLIAVNEVWGALERAMNRACSNGYMPDALGEEWNAFDWREAPQPAAPSFVLRLKLGGI